MKIFTVAFDEITGVSSMIGNCSPIQAMSIIQQLTTKAVKDVAERKANENGGSRLLVPNRPQQGKLFPPN